MAWLLPFAWLASALGFTVQWREQWLPARPDPAALVPEHPGSWFHFLKNVTTECVRADPEWWSKFFCFLTVLEFLLIVLWSIA
jgi:hypothetical protein